MSFLGNWPSGINYSLIYSGIDNIFMLGSGGTMIVLDLSDPEQPETISEVRSRSLVDCAFFDTETNRLYLGAYFSGVEIWDLNDMQHPSGWRVSLLKAIQEAVYLLRAILFML